MHYACLRLPEVLEIALGTRGIGPSIVSSGMHVALSQHLLILSSLVGRKCARGGHGAREQRAMQE